MNAEEKLNQLAKQGTRFEHTKAEQTELLRNIRDLIAELLGK